MDHRWDYWSAHREYFRDIFEWGGIRMGAGSGVRCLNMDNSLSTQWSHACVVTICPRSKKGKLLYQLIPIPRSLAASSFAFFPYFKCFRCCSGFATMPKRAATPPPADDEPKYLTVIHPYPLHPNMELVQDRENFGRWLACCIGPDPFYAFFYKPSVGHQPGGVNLGGLTCPLGFQHRYCWGSSQIRFIPSPAGWASMVRVSQESVRRREGQSH